MAAIDFPASPTNGQVFVANGRVYRYSTAAGAWMSFEFLRRATSDGENIVEPFGGNWLFNTGMKWWSKGVAEFGTDDGANFRAENAAAGGGWGLRALGPLGAHESNLEATPEGSLAWSPDGAGPFEIWPMRATASPAPTVTALAGAFTTVAAELNSQRSGDAIEWDLTVTITTNGTAAGGVQVAMPFTALKECVAAGREAGVTGAMCQGVMAAGSSNLVILKYDNTYPGGTGHRISLSGRSFVN